MRDDGVVPETCLINTLTLLLARHVDAMSRQDPSGILDVLSLSLGYYHESPSDALMDGPFGQLLADFGRHGVAVVAAAGNATTLAPMYPAGFASQATGFAPDQVPLASVGALNPDGSTVAYYSNAGTWVTTHRPGSSLVSCFPTDATASAQASAHVDFAGRARSTQDPDDFQSGFCTWSGTSFAAPVLAGQIAAQLAADPTLPDLTITAAVARGRAAMLAEIPEWTGLI